MPMSEVFEGSSEHSALIQYPLLAAGIRGPKCRNCRNVNGWRKVERPCSYKLARTKIYFARWFGSAPAARAAQPIFATVAMLINGTADGVAFATLSVGHGARCHRQDGLRWTTDTWGSPASLPC